MYNWIILLYSSNTTLSINYTSIKFQAKCMHMVSICLELMVRIIKHLGVWKREDINGTIN